MLAITYTNQDIINAQQNTNKSLLYPSDYWNDKIAQISIQKPNLNYFTENVTSGGAVKSIISLLPALN